MSDISTLSNILLKWVKDFVNILHVGLEFVSL